MKIYVDFDGVILDTWKLLRHKYKDLDLISEEEKVKYIQNINWDELLKNSDVVNNSIEILKKLRMDLAILTKVNSLNNEAAAKIKLLRKFGIKNEVIICPYDLKKTDIVPVVGNALIDDTIYNLDDWKQHGGIPIYFNKDNSDIDDCGSVNKDYVKIKSLDSLYYMREKMHLYKFLN